MAAAIRTRPQIEIGPIFCRPRLTACLVVCTDLLALLITGVISIYGRWMAGGQYDPSLYTRLWPLLGVFLLIYKFRGLYPAHGLNEIEELRRLITTTAMVCIALAASIFLMRDAYLYSRIVLLGFSLLSVLFLPLGRAVLRKTCGLREWWGMPVVVLGENGITRKVVSALLQRPELGLRPVAILADDLLPGSKLEGVVVLGGIHLATMLAQQNKVSTAVVALSRLQDAELSSSLGKFASAFPNVLIVASMTGFSTLWVEAHGLGQFLTLHVRHGLRMVGPRLLKRVIDLVLTFFIWLIVAPLVLLTAIAVKLTSRGPVFYGQTRVGQQGQRFKAWKFRTMVRDADSILQQYLEANPRKKAEWMRDHKLKDDPRITPIGHFLRRTSIDELPQLWNVLKGEMSLVGPRPIVEEEIPKYADQFDIYSKVAPGITGLWQVSGRNNTSYAERVEFDSFYVNNWSPWLDVYLLAKTVRAVIVKDGAY